MERNTNLMSRKSSILLAMNVDSEENTLNMVFIEYSVY